MHNSINFTWSRSKHFIYKKPINLEFRLHYSLCIFFLNLKKPYAQFRALLSFDFY